LIAGYKEKLNAAPQREKDLNDLNRDDAILQTSYQSLLAKQEEAMIDANVERANIGEQFRVIDPANLPESPYNPNRWQQWTLAGSVMGLALGILIVALLEYFDSSFKRGEEIASLLGLPTLALIPVISTPSGEPPVIGDVPQ